MINVIEIKLGLLMGDDIGLGLSSMAVCFDFHSTKVVQLSNLILAIRFTSKICNKKNYNLTAKFDGWNCLVETWTNIIAVKIDVSFEVTHQIATSLILVLFSISQTRTSSGLEVLFNPEGDVLFGINGVIIFSGSMILSFASFMFKVHTYYVK